MRTLLLLIIVSFFSTTSFASFNECRSTDGELKVFIKSDEGYVTAIKLLRQVELRQINESLPAGIYSNHQDINEQINWYFEDHAYLTVTTLKTPNKARVLLYGMGQESPRLVALSKTIICKSDI